MVVSLTVFPQAISPGDSALATCIAADADGDSLMWFWYGYGPIHLKDDRSFDGRMVIYAADSIAAAVDSAGVLCEVSDRRGRMAYARVGLIVVRQGAASWDPSAMEVMCDPGWR